MALGSVYAALGPPGSRLRLFDVREPTPERDGRAKKYFKITGKDMKVVQETQQTLTRLWKGLPKLQGGKA